MIKDIYVFCCWMERWILCNMQDTLTTTIQGNLLLFMHKLCSFMSLLSHIFSLQTWVVVMCSASIVDKAITIYSLEI
jgi:hypothetical protein